MAGDRANTIKHLAKERGVSERKLIIDAIESAGTVTGAADNLGVSRNTMQYWMDKLNLQLVPAVRVIEAGQ